MARPPKVKPSKALSGIRKYRQATGATQGPFWAMFGTTQSGGSRYENERDMPLPVGMLIVLREQGIVSDEQLRTARAVVEASR